MSDRALRQPSQNARILELLADGREHEMRDIHRRVGFMRLNSRVAELRNPKHGGHNIVCRREGTSYFYRLISTEQTPGMVSSERLGQASTSPHETPVAVSVGSSGAGKVTEATGCLTAEPPAPDLGQLNLWDSAAAPRARQAA